MLSAIEHDTFPVGFELGSGEPVSAEYHHLAIFGLTQKAGKTTALEGFISRLEGNFRILVFRTGRGDIGFESATEIPFYFRERTDWRYVEGLISAHLDEKNKILRAEIIKTCRDAKSLEEVWKKVQETLGKPRLNGFLESIYTQLNQYLSEVVPEISKVPFSGSLELVDGISLMDLENVSRSMQQLIIAASIDYVMQHLTSTIVVLPEGWNFIPGQKNTPAKLSIERLVREGAKLRNFLWVDSQYLTGLDMNVMRSIGVWLFGRQDLPLEAERFVESIGQKGLKKEEIRSLEIGQFYLVQGRDVKKVYVWPAWLDAEESRKIAMGAPLIPRPENQRPVNRLIKRPEQKPILVNKAEKIVEKKEDEMDKEMLERLEKLEKRLNEQDKVIREKDQVIEQLQSEKPTQAEPEKPEPKPVEVKTEVEAYEVTIRKKGPIVRNFSTSGVQGKILYILTKSYLNTGTRDEIINAAAEIGWKMDNANTNKQLGALVGLGYLIRNEGPPVNFRMPEGVKITVEGE